MHIAFITPKMIVGGAETYILTKAAYLCAQGHRVLVLSEGGENVAHLPTGATHITFPTDVAPYHLSQRVFNERIAELAHILSENKIEVVEAHNTFPILYASLACGKTKVPCLYNLLNELSHNKQLLTNMLVKAFSKAGCYFTLTEQTNQYVEQQLKTKLHPIIIPIPVTSIDAHRDCQAEGYVLSVCRFSADKMYVLPLIDGFGRALNEGKIPKGTLLKIVGDGALYEQVSIAAQRVNSRFEYTVVELLGTQMSDALEQLFRHCTLYVGMGTTLLTAAQLHKPIVKVGFEPHTIPFAWGYWGAEPADAHRIVAANERNPPLDFAQALEIVNFENQLTQRGNQAYQMYREHYQIDSIMERWVGEYTRVVEQGYTLRQSTICALRAKLWVLMVMKKIQQRIKR